MEIPELIKEQVAALPKNPGVYFFKDRTGEILYVGKATSLRDRVRSYWAKDLNRGPAILQMVAQIRIIDHVVMESSVEALIAEANYIKQHLPKYNVRLRDDKSYFYVKLDNSDQSGFPRLSMVHKNQILKDEKGIRYFGPYTSGKQLRLSLKIIRKIFPYRSCTVMPHKPCLQYHIKRCEAPCVDLVTKKQYQGSIRSIVQLLEGKKAQLVTRLKRSMQQASRKQQFEEAARLRNQYIALEHLHQAANISDADPELSVNKVRGIVEDNIPRRIEGYDVSNLSGKDASVSMVVFLYGTPAKHLYKQFTIKSVAGPDDYAMLREAMTRRLARAQVSADGAEEMVNQGTWDISDNESWQLPDLFIIDGGKGQLQTVKQVLDQNQVSIPILAIAKGPTRKGEDLYFSQDIQFRDPKLIRAVRDEAHRFAGRLHRSLRTKRVIHSQLDDISGIGPVRRQALLRHFGSVEKIKTASVDELTSIVGQNTAHILIQLFTKSV